MATELEEASQEHEYRTLFGTLRRFSRNTKRTNDNTRKTDGFFVRAPEERLQRWRKFYQQLYNHGEPQGTPANSPPINAPPSLATDAEPTIEEIKLAIKQLKNNKAAGIDEVTVEMLKAGGNPVAQRLHSMLQLVWRSEEIPAAWKRSIIIPILKKGDSLDCKNYRGISLLSIVGKIFTRIIQQRLQEHR